MRFAVVARSVAARLGLASAIEAEPGVCVAASGELLMDVEPTLHTVDVLVFDIDSESLPELQDVDVPLVLLGAEPSALADDRGDHGWAFLSRDAGGPEIVAAARAATLGLLVYDRASRRIENQEFDPQEPSALSSREIEILQLLADGLANKQIAARLDISIHTVKFHVAAVLHKLDASSRTEAVTVGMRSGLIKL